MPAMRGRDLGYSLVLFLFPCVASGQPATPSPAISAALPRVEVLATRERAKDYFYGRGVTKDHVQALMWANIALGNATAEDRDECVVLRDSIPLARKMTTMAISEAGRLAQQWFEIRCLPVPPLAPGSIVSARKDGRPRVFVEAAETVDASNSSLVESAVVAGLLCAAPCVRAQSTTSRFTPTIDASFGGGASTNTAALSANLFYGIGSSGRAKLGLGVRVASFLGGDATVYSTADAALIRAKQINTLAVANPRTQSVNLAFQLKYGLSDRLEGGFNIDIIGAGFGSARTGIYASTKASLAGSQGADVSSSNSLRGGKPDRGQLDSEFFLAYWPKPRWAVRVGFSHFLSEYTTVVPLDFTNSRYRRTANLGFLALTFKP